MLAVQTAQPSKTKVQRRERIHGNALTAERKASLKESKSL